MYIRSYLIIFFLIMFFLLKVILGLLLYIYCMMVKDLFFKEKLYFLRVLFDYVFFFGGGDKFIFFEYLWNEFLLY